MADFYALTLAVRVVTIGSIRKIQTGKSIIPQVSFYSTSFRKQLFRRILHQISSTILLKINSAMVTPNKTTQKFSGNKTNRAGFSNETGTDLIWSDCSQNVIKFSSTTVVTPNNEIISLFDLDKKVKNWPSFAKMRHKLSYLTCLPEISSVLFEVNTVDYFPKF